VCCHWVDLFCAADCLDSDVLKVLARFMPTLRCWIMIMWIMGEVEQAGRLLGVFHKWLGSKIEDDGAKRLLKQLYCQFNSALAVSILSSGRPFVPLFGGPSYAFAWDTVGLARIVAEEMGTRQPRRSKVMSDRARGEVFHREIREDVVYVEFSFGDLTSIAGDWMCEWHTTIGSCTQKYLDTHVHDGATVGSMLKLRRGSLNVPLQMDQNRLCLKRDDITIPICCLPGYFEPTTPAIQQGNLVCIGGTSGLIALINLDRLTIPDH